MEKIIERFRELFIPKNKKGDISMERYLGIIRGQEQFILESLAGQREEMLDIISKKTKVAELKVDDNDQLWVRIDTIYSGKPKGVVLLLDAEELKLLT